MKSLLLLIDGDIGGTAWTAAEVTVGAGDLDGNG